MYSIKQLNLKIQDLQEQLEFSQNIIEQMQTLIDSLRYQLEKEQEFRKAAVRYLIDPNQYKIDQKDDDLPF